MPRGVSTPAAVRDLIMKLRLEEKLSIRAIANRVKRTKNVVGHTLAKYGKKDPSTADVSSGRPRKTSTRDDTALVTS